MNSQPSVPAFITNVYSKCTKYYSFLCLISKLGINFVVCIMWIDESGWNNLLLSVPNCHEVTTMVATSGHYGCTIVMSYTEINKAVSQWPLTFKLCISVTWPLTHWGRATHICVSKLTIIGSDNGLTPARRILLIGTLGRNFNEILIEIHTISFKEMHLKMSSGKCRPFCLGLNVLSCAVHIPCVARTLAVL